MRITQTMTFEAAHYLPHVPDGHRCRRMHGHSYRIEVSFDGAVDPTTGWIVDFDRIERELAGIIERLDHHTLNDIDGLENPTAENVVLWLLERVPKAAHVRVYETPRSWAEASR